MDYVTGYGRFSAFAGDGYQWYNAGVGTTKLMDLSSAGNLVTTGTITAPEVIASNGLFVNSQTVSVNYTIPTGSNAMSVGATVAGGITVTVPSGSKWVVL